MKFNRTQTNSALAALLPHIEDSDLRTKMDMKLWRHTNISSIRGREPIGDLWVNCHPMLALHPMSDRW